MPSMIRRIRTRLPTYLSTGLGALVDICIAPGCAPDEASKTSGAGTANPIGGPNGLADELRKQLTGCLFFVATAESESRAVCQLVELRMSRFLTDRVCVMCKSQAARFIRRRLKMNKTAAPTRNRAGISLSRA